MSLHSKKKQRHQRIVKTLKNNLKKRKIFQSKINKGFKGKKK